MRALILVVMLLAVLLGIWYVDGLRYDADLEQDFNREVNHDS